MTGRGEAKGREGGRPAVLAVVLVIETAAALFFITDTMNELRESGFAAHQWLEGLVTMALVINPT